MHGICRWSYNKMYLIQPVHTAWNTISHNAMCSAKYKVYYVSDFDMQQVNPCRTFAYYAQNATFFFFFLKLVVCYSECTVSRNDPYFSVFLMCTDFQTLGSARVTVPSWRPKWSISPSFLRTQQCCWTPTSTGDAPTHISNSLKLYH